jgi:atypical dual specificity phosphatase
MPITVILDLNPKPTYRWEAFSRNKKNKEFQSVVYYHLPIYRKELPSEKELNKVYDYLNKNLYKPATSIISCFHGINRTGYVSSFFLCKKFSIKVDEAVARFNTARGYTF